MTPTTGPIRFELTRSSAAQARWSSALYAGVIAMVLWTPIPFASVEPWAVGIMRTIVFGLVVVWAVGAANQGRLVIDSSPLQIFVYVGVALCWIQASASLSVDPFSTRQFALTLLACGLFLSVALVALDTVERLQRAAWILFWFGFVVALFGIIQRLSGTPNIYWFRVMTHEGVTPFGPFVNKNHFAGFVELAIAPGLGLLLAGAIPKGARFVFLFAAAVMGVAVFLSGSRGGALSLVVELIILGTLGVVTHADGEVPKSRRIAVSALGGAALAASIALGVLWLGPKPLGRGFSNLTDELESSDVISRTGIWRDTLKLVESRPVLGVGLGAYATAFTAVASGDGTFGVRQAHNDYLQLLAEGGVAGAVLGVGFLASLTAAGWHAVRCRDAVRRGVGMGAASGCLGLLVHSFVDFNLQIVSNVVVFVFCAALVSRAATARDTQTS